MKSKNKLLKIIQKDIFKDRKVRPYRLTVKIPPLDAKMERNFKIEILYQKYLINRLYKEVRKSKKTLAHL